MADDRKISIVIPTWNRYELLIESFINVLHDDRVSEIVISDDASDINIYNEVADFVRHYPKIKLYRSNVNQDCYMNKCTAVSLSSNEWVIVFDSDNVIDKDYLDRIYEIDHWDSKTSYMPSWAAPTFIYKDYEGLFFSNINVASYLGKPMFDTMLNCMNFFINRNEYICVFDDTVNPNTADSIYFNYCWFKFGNKMYVVPGLTYQHRIHPESHYVLNNHKTKGFYEQVINKLSNL